MENTMNKNEVMPGSLSVTFKETDDFNTLCCRLAGYSSDRFEAIALRLFAGKEVIATMYVLDKQRQEGSNFDPERLPVKKIKLENVSVAKLFEWFEEFNFTINTGNYNIEDMEVINK